MSPETQIALWGLAASLPLALNLWAKRTDAIGLSAMLLLTWCFGRITGALFTPPESMQLYPLVDAACGITAFLAWATSRARWKLVLTGLFVIQSCLHVAFWAAWVSNPTDKATLYTYVLANNLLFASELLCVSGGALGDVARALGDRVLGRPRARGHARPGS